MTPKSESEMMTKGAMTMKATTRVEMGLMAGVLATVAMTIAVVAVTAISSAWNGFFVIQWYSWLGAVFGATGTPGQLAELGVVWFLIIGIAAGWLAGQLMKGGGYGLIGDLVLGVIGAFIGGWLFGVLGISAGGLIGRLITATIGAAVLLFLIRLIKKA